MFLSKRRRRRNRRNKGGVVFGPIIMLGAILCLWTNEGRFDYYQAAKKAQVLAAPLESASYQSVAFTVKLGTLEIGGRYIEKLPGYLQVQELAEIYSWERPMMMMGIAGRKDGIGIFNGTTVIQV